MRIDPHSAPAPAATARTATPAGKTPALDFAAVHAATVQRRAGATPTASGRTASATADAAPARPGADRTAPAPAAMKGEEYQAVPGRPFDEIMAGPRNGMYMNRSGNDRDGQAFVMVKRDGREFHIYGKGTDRVVVPVDPPAASPAGAPAATPPKGAEAAPSPAAAPPAGKDATYEHVPGRSYAQITSGPEKGMHINRSGNERDGKSFVLVKRDQHEFHIYGTGKSRQIISVTPPTTAGSPPAPSSTPSKSPPALAPALAPAPTPPKSPPALTPAPAPGGAAPVAAPPVPIPRGAQVPSLAPAQAVLGQVGVPGA